MNHKHVYLQDLLYHTNRDTSPDYTIRNWLPSVYTDATVPVELRAFALQIELKLVGREREVSASEVEAVSRVATAPEPDSWYAVPQAWQASAEFPRPIRELDAMTPAEISHHLQSVAVALGSVYDPELPSGVNEPKRGALAAYLLFVAAVGGTRYQS